MSVPEHEMRCEEAIRLLAEYLDGGLGDEHGVGLRRHLEACRSCWSRAEFERRLRAQLAGLRRREVTPAFERRIRTLIRRFGRTS
ncbi:MAG: anti-sigma factor family protein [Gemmatimonadota bacterium]